MASNNGDIILGCILLFIGTLFLVYSILGRLFGFHRPIGWIGGGHVNVYAEISSSIFVLCCGLVVLHSPVWVLIAIPTWLICFLLHNRANRQYHIDENKLRAKNAVKYPGVFDTSPPDDINSFPDEEFDLFDAGTCTYLGKAYRQDILMLINELAEIAKQKPNDIFMLFESMEILPKESMSQDLIKLLENAFEKRDYLVLRWLPVSLNKINLESS